MVLPLIIAIVVVWALGGLLVLAMCRSATVGDAHLDGSESTWRPTPGATMHEVEQRLRSLPSHRSHVG